MATAILYLSKHGTTEKVGKAIASQLNDRDVHLFNIKEEKQMPLELYDQVVVGSSIHMGKIPGQMTQFLNQHQETLLEKPLALYLCCMHEPPIDQEQLMQAYPKVLREHALYTGIVGGEFLFEKMNFIDRLMVKQVVGVKESQSKIKEEEIQNLIDCMNQRYKMKEPSL